MSVESIVQPRRINWISKVLFLALLAGAGFILAKFPLSMVGLGVIASFIFFISLIHPKIGAFLLVPAIPFSGLFQVSFGGINIGLIEATLALICLTWLLQMMTRQTIIIPHPPMLWPFLFFGGVIGLSWINTFSLTGSLIETIKWVEMLAIYLYLTATFKPQDRRWLMMIILLTGLTQAGVGLYQFIFKAGPPGFLLFDGRFLRAFGTFQQPNPYAGYLGLILPMAISLTLWGWEQLQGDNRQEATFWLLLAGGTSVALVGAIFATQSRGAWLGVLVALTVTILLKGGKWGAGLGVGLISLAILIAMGGLILLPNSITQRFSETTPYLGLTDVSTVAVTDANFATIERLAHWQAAQAMWLDHLWLGVGFGNYAAIYPAYAVGRWLDPLGHAHNYLLNVAAEMGLIGLLGYLIFWGWLIFLIIRAMRQASSHHFKQAMMIGAMGMIAHLHVHNMVDNLYVQGMYLHLALIFGLISPIERMPYEP